MDFSISPLSGIGVIKFGMSPSEVRKHVGAGYRSFKRTPNSSYPCDHFEQLGVFCYYNSAEELEAVEFAAPARPTINGLALINLDFESAVNSLVILDDQTSREVDGAIAYRAGLSIYAPLAKTNPKAPVESVVAFAPGYYN